MALDIAISLIVFVTVIAGFVGCIVPVIPGPIVAFVGLLVVSLAQQWSTLPLWLLTVLGLVAVAVTVLDSVLPSIASKRAGAGRGGVWGSLIGMLIGTFLFPPFGIVIGAFFGALLGEMLFHGENKSPLKAATAVFSGTLVAVLLKLLVTGLVSFYSVRAAIALF